MEDREASARVGRTWLFVPLVVALAACDVTLSANASINSSCTVQGECPSGELCLVTGSGGTCQSTCAPAGRDCAVGLVCLPVTGTGLSACLPPEPDASSEKDADATTTPVADVYAPPEAAQSPDADGEDAEAGPSDAPEENDAADVAPPPLPCDGGSPPSAIVLFGGTSVAGVFGDTWIWDGTSWANPPGESGDTDGGPPARYDAVMSAACGYAVLAGGIDTRAQPIPDAWLWNGSRWQPSSSPPPEAYSAAAGTLDGSMYIFGGINAQQHLSPALFSWRGGTWSLPSLGGAAPSARDDAVFANSSAGLLLFGGATSLFGDLTNETWLLTGSMWVLQDAGADAASWPSSRAFAAAAAWGTSVVLFGGQGADSTNPLDDTWIWDGSTWTPAVQSGGPPARYGAMMASLNGVVVLFGGYVSNHVYLDDTWIWNGSWTQGPSGPPGRANAAMSAY